MKNIKKNFSMLLVVVMILSMSIIANADTPKGSITVDDGNAQGTYNGYLLINSTNYDTNKNRFAYTINEKYVHILYAAAYDKEVTDPETTTNKHTKVMEYLDAEDFNDAMMRVFADKVYRLIQAANEAAPNSITPDETFVGGTKKTVTQGYWLVVDSTDYDSKEESVNSLAMVDTSGLKDLVFKVKKTLPTVEKKVSETDDTATAVWQDAADCDIGDTVFFKVEGTLSQSMSSYLEYFYAFHDTMENLTYKNGSAVVTVDDVDVTDKFTVAWNPDTKKLDVSINDLLSMKDANDQPIAVTDDSKVVLTYSASLDETAVCDNEGNANVVTVEYSNNPYNTESTGNTTADEVVVFTYKLVVYKVYDYDAEFEETPDDMSEYPNGVPLKGAGFTLYQLNEDGVYVLIETINQPDGSEFIFYGLDAGTYKLVETTVPDGFNKADDLEFVIAAEYDTDAKDPKLTVLTVNDLSGATITVSVDNPVGSFSSNVENASVTTYIKNTSGSKMPSTGGVGTMLLYTFGGIIFAGSLVLLVIKLRTRNEKEAK